MTYQPRRSFGRRTTGAPSAFKPRHSFKPGQRKGPGKQYIEASRFVKAAKEVTQVKYEATNSFNDFAISDSIKRNIVAKGYKTPSKIQDIAIPHGLAGRDVVGIANTGTGKTTAFAIPVIEKLLQNNKSAALIIAPTRELADQIDAEVKSLSRGTNIRTCLIIGGTPMSPQFRQLKANPRVIIGTPGRIKDHVQQGTLRLGVFDTIVLDEVDRMVDMGFINDIRFLLNEVAEKRQSLFFSATMDPKIEALVHSFLKDPITVSVKTAETSDNVEQNVVRHGDINDKFNKLHDVLKTDAVAKTLIFDDTKRSVEKLSRDLIAKGFKAEALHGGKSQNQRKRALDKFRKNDVNILVATDVAARGIDIIDITHVINYSTPQTYDDYIHRIGRAGRAGRTGNALTFINEHGR
ncbi:MAG: DEAD/DEAH box helicase [bacterium]